MKLYELVGVKKFADLDLHDVLSTMRDYEEAGEGVNAIVIKHGSRSEVIKFWLEDAAYEDFIDYVQKHPSKYFPKLYSKPKVLTAFFLRPKDFPKKVKYIRMEELEETRYPFDGFLKLLERLINVIKIRHTKSFEEFMEKHGLEFEKFKKDFTKTIYDLAMNISDDHFVDIHSGNIMMRGPTPVIIDIFGSGKSMDITGPIIKRLKRVKDLPPNERSK